MHLPLGPALLGPPPPDTVPSQSYPSQANQSQDQLPLGLAPTGDFAFVRERVHKDALDKWDALTPRHEIRLHQGRVWFPEAAQGDFTAGYLTPTSWATSQFCQRLGMPTAYFRKCPPSLQDLQFNHWITQEPMLQAIAESAEPASRDANPGEAGANRWLLRAKGDVLRGVLSERYAPLDNDCLVDCLAGLIPKSFAVDWFSLDDTSLHLRLVDARSARQLLPNDDLMVGCHIGNSEVGRRAVTVDALVYRLVCQNGMIRLVKGKSLLYRRHLHLSAPRFRELLEGAILGALDAATAFLDTLQEASRTPVPDVPAVLKLLADQNGLSQCFLERAQQSLRSEPVSQQETVWGLANGLTQAAQRLSADDRYAVETLAGRLIEHGPPRLPSPAALLVRGRRLTKELDEPNEGNETEGNDSERNEDEKTEEESPESTGFDNARSYDARTGDARNGSRFPSSQLAGNGFGSAQRPLPPSPRGGSGFAGREIAANRFDADRTARPVLGGD